MTKKPKISEKYRVWIDARKKYHLSHAHIQMARELGMNPKKFGKIANHKQEPWKAPLPVFIEEIYYKRFGKKQPEQINSIDQFVKIRERKKLSDGFVNSKGKRIWSTRRINRHDFSTDPHSHNFLTIHFKLNMLLI